MTKCTCYNLYPLPFKDLTKNRLHNSTLAKMLARAAYFSAAAD